MKHSLYDGLDTVLQVYGQDPTYIYIIIIYMHYAGIEEEGIAAIRDARIVTVIEVSEDGMIAISSSDADSDDEANTVTFTPGASTNISNPLNDETVEVILSAKNNPIAMPDAVYWDSAVSNHFANQGLRARNHDCGDQDLAIQLSWGCCGERFLKRISEIY